MEQVWLERNLETLDREEEEIDGEVTALPEFPAWVKAREEAEEQRRMEGSPRKLAKKKSAPRVQVVDGGPLMIGARQNSVAGTNVSSSKRSEGGGKKSSETEKKGKEKRSPRKLVKKSSLRPVEGRPISYGWKKDGGGSGVHFG